MGALTRSQRVGGRSGRIPCGKPQVDPVSSDRLSHSSIPARSLRLPGRLPRSRYWTVHSLSPSTLARSSWESPRASRRAFNRSRKVEPFGIGLKPRKRMAAGRCRESGRPGQFSSWGPDQRSPGYGPRRPLGAGRIPRRGCRFCTGLNVLTRPDGYLAVLSSPSSESDHNTLSRRYFDGLQRLACDRGHSAPIGLQMRCSTN